VTAKAGIPSILFASVTGFAQRLQIADVVAAPLGNGDDVIDLKLNLWRRFSATAAAKAISLEDILPHRCWDEDALTRSCFPHGRSKPKWPASHLKERRQRQWKRDLDLGLQKPKFDLQG